MHRCQFLKKFGSLSACLGYKTGVHRNKRVPLRIKYQQWGKQIKYSDNWTYIQKHTETFKGFPRIWHLCLREQERKLLFAEKMVI